MKSKKRERRRCVVLTWTAAASTLLSAMPVSNPLSTLRGPFLCPLHSIFSLVGRVERRSGLLLRRWSASTTIVHPAPFRVTPRLCRGPAVRSCRSPPSSCCPSPSPPPSSQPFSIGLSFCFAPLCARQPAYRTSRPPLPFSHRHSPSARQRASAPVPEHRSRFHMYVRVRCIVCGSLLI